MPGDDKGSRTLRVDEIFYSLQGESSFAGYPCVFVRLTGCNLRCSYCDTTYAYDGGTDVEISDILREMERFGCNLVEITGGEPLLQDNVTPLVESLLERDFTVLVETNGSVDIDRAPAGAIRIVDLKCPSSGEHARNDLRNLKRLTPQDELKFVIGDRADYDFAKRMLQLISEEPGVNRIVHFSAVTGKLNPRDLADWILEDRLPVRLQLQLHKILWPEAERGR